MKIQTWFPTSIAVVEDVISKKEHNFLKNKILKLNKAEAHPQWHSNVKTSYGKYDLTFDKDFDNLIEQTRLHTIKFAKTMGSYDGYKVKQSWYVVYNEGDFQEYHAHGNSIISAIYFIKADDKSAKLYFKSPFQDQLAPEYKGRNADTWERIFYNAVPGRLLVFRSYLEHCVEMQKDKELRITSAYNFARNYV